MRLSSETIREYQEIHQEEFGVLLDDNQAEAMAQKWLSFFSTIFKPHENEHSEPPRRAA